MSDQDGSALTDEQRVKAEQAAELKAAKAKYGPKTAILYDDDLGKIVIAVRGKRAQFNLWQTQVKDSKFEFTTVCEEFCKQVVVEPDRETLTQMFNDAPQVGVTIAIEAKQLFEGDFKQLGKG
jgi:hypothetical protein